MSGTKAGGIKAMQTNKQRYGDGSNGKESFAQIIGRRGGLLSRGGGFQKGSEATKEAGRLGGQISKRTKEN